MHKILCLLAFLFLTQWVVAPAAAGGVLPPIPLWPGTPPDERGSFGPEHDFTSEKDRKVNGDSVVRLIDVTQPTLTVHTPEKPNGTAVVICPGGGYHILAINLEGDEIAQWLNSLGVTAIVLKYRVPVRPKDDEHRLPLQDAQRALGLVRARASEWGVKTNKIGLIGFSAGGHLTARLCVDHDQRAYAAVDAADQVSCRPDFAMMVYPAYLTTKDKTALAPEMKITPQTPPAFLVQTEDDPVHAECSILYYLGLMANKVPAELHIYPHGGHGYGARPSTNEVSTWPSRAEEWMRGRGLLDR